MKKKITEEEYQKILERLSFIAEEEKLLETLVENKEYIAHVPLANNFEKLLVNLQRNNYEIDREIENIIKLFLEMNVTNKKIKQELKSLLELQQLSLEADTQTEEPLEFISIEAHYPGFQAVFAAIKDNVAKKKANNYLTEYITSLQEENESLIMRKNTYEKQIKKQNRKKILTKLSKINPK